MKIHELKTWPEPFNAVRRGDKTHEVRANDRDFQEGDVLHLREWRPDQIGNLTGNVIRKGEYTGDELLVRVTHVTPGGNFGLPENLCCMSIKVLTWQITA